MGKISFSGSDGLLSNTKTASSFETLLRKGSNKNGKMKTAIEKKSDPWVSKGELPFNDQTKNVFDPGYRPEQRGGFKIPVIGNPASLFAALSLPPSHKGRLDEIFTDKNGDMWSWVDGYGWKGIKTKHPVPKSADIKPASSQRVPIINSLPYIAGAAALISGALLLKFGGAKRLANMAPKTFSSLSQTWKEIKFGAQIMFGQKQHFPIDEVSSAAAPRILKSPFGGFNLLMSKLDDLGFSEKQISNAASAIADNVSGQRNSVTRLVGSSVQLGTTEKTFFAKIRKSSPFKKLKQEINDTVNWLFFRRG